MPTSPWSSEAIYNFSDQTPLLNTGKTQDQIDAENLDRETKAAIQKSRKIKKAKEQEKAAGRTQRNRQTWNPAEVAKEAIAQPLQNISSKLDEVLAPVNKVVADVGEQVDKNLYGIKDAQELAKRRRLRSGDKGEVAKLKKEQAVRTNPITETGNFILKSTGPGIIEDYGSQLIKAGQEGMARVGEAIGRPVAPEQDPRSDRYIKAQIDFGITPDDPTAAKAAEFLKLVNGMRFLNRVAPGTGASGIKKLVRSGGLDFFAGFMSLQRTLTRT
jgi:hypothetical protein